MSAPRLQLYTRAGCHLCDELLAEAAPILARFDASVDPVDVDADAELARRYGLAVPVLTLDGREVCRHRLDARALEAALRRSNADCDR